MIRGLRVTAIAVLAVLLCTAAYWTFERAVSDIATRVRYALRNTAFHMDVLREDSRVLVLRPNGWPDGCGERPWRILLSPYAGGKQVPSADIHVQCEGGRRYSTGTRLLVPRELEARKVGDAAVILKLTRMPEGIAVSRID